MLTVRVFCISAHTSNGQDLLVLLDALLELPKQDAQATGIIIRPERLGKRSHIRKDPTLQPFVKIGQWMGITQNAATEVRKGQKEPRALLWIYMKEG